MDSIDRALLQCSLEFHGSQLLDALREEQGESFLVASVASGNSTWPPPSTPIIQCSSTAGEQVVEPRSIEVVEDVHQSLKPSVSESRRSLLVSFISKKADMLFRKMDDVFTLPVINELETKDHYGIVPPLEYFMDVDEEARKMHFYQNLRKGDIVVGSVFGKHTHGLLIRLLCLTAGRMAYVHDLCLRCFCNLSQIPLRSAHEDPLESFDVNDLIQGVVLDVQPLIQKIYISMKDTALPPELQQKCKLGLITEESLPIHYRECLSAGSKRYSDILEDAHGFANPNAVSHMAMMLGLDLSSSPSLMRGLHKRKYPKEDYASDLYKVQCARWAYKSVEQGVRYFKSGNKVEAFQCLNKALQIDPCNVEALVARGALFANNSSFKRALEDFYKAIDQNPKHANALKFTVETLIALGKQYEEQNNSAKVVDCYKKALKLNPSHLEATERLSAFHEKIQGLERDEKARQIELESETAAAGSSKSCDTKQRLKQLLSSEKTGKQEHRHRPTKRRNSPTYSSDSSKNHRRKRSQRDDRSSSTDDSRSSNSSRTYDHRRSRSCRRDSKRKRKSLDKKRRSRKSRYSRKKRHHSDSSTTSTTSSSSSTSTTSSSSSTSSVSLVKDIRSKKYLTKSSKSITSDKVVVVKPQTLRLGRDFRGQEVKTLVSTQVSRNSISPTKNLNENCSTIAAPSTSRALSDTLGDDPKIICEFRPTEASNGKDDKQRSGAGDGQSLAELESFLAELRAKQNNKITK